ncbi:MAG: minor capsid protein [Deltaproteobacteria bacterium]|nr:minor capsid protein [Deltaproteobacteria bacterium]
MHSAALQPLRPLPFEEAAAFWADKIPLTPAQFKKLRDDAKIRAFAVSGIAKMDVVTDVFAALQKAIASGTTLDEFKKSIRSVIEERGWTGRAAWRVDNIFRTNVLTAYNVGKYSQQKRAGVAYLQYDAVGDVRTRPLHAAMDGRVFRANDPIWDKWYPPNGYRCRCTTRGMSEAEFKARGLKAESGEDWDGRMVDVGNGRLQALLPDPSFSHNPGKVMFGSFERKPGQPTEMEGLRGPERYRRRQVHNIRPADLSEGPRDLLLPEGLPQEQYWDAFREAFGIEPGGEAVVRDVLGDPVIVSDRMYSDKRGASKLGKEGHGTYVRTMPGILMDPYEVWPPPTVYPDGRIVLRKRYVQVWRTPDKERIGGVVITEVERGRLVGVTGFSPEKLEYVDARLRKGVLLHGK